MIVFKTNNIPKVNNKTNIRRSTMRYKVAEGGKKKKFKRVW